MSKEDIVGVHYETSFGMSLKPIECTTEGPKVYLEFSPQYWMRLDDVLDIVGKVENGRLWQGCCGPSGVDGPNRKCKCGEPVGSEEMIV